MNLFSNIAALVKTEADNIVMKAHLLKTNGLSGKKDFYHR